jgi:hypothetical protein
VSDYSPEHSPFHPPYPRHNFYTILIVCFSHESEHLADQRSLTAQGQSQSITTDKPRRRTRLNRVISPRRFRLSSKRIWTEACSYKTQELHDLFSTFSRTGRQALRPRCRECLLQDVVTLDSAIPSRQQMNSVSTRSTRPNRVFPTDASTHTRPTSLRARNLTSPFTGSE